MQRPRKSRLCSRETEPCLTLTSKTDTKEIIGTAGTKAILEAISTERPVGTVSIGGINLSNVQRVLYQTAAPNKALDGAAVVSAIMAADNPKLIAACFVKRMRTAVGFGTIRKDPQPDEIASLLQEVPSIVRKVVEAHPLVHSMINYVVVNFAANVALAM